MRDVWRTLDPDEFVPAFATASADEGAPPVSEEPARTAAWRSGGEAP